MPPITNWKVKNIAMIPNSTVAMRVFLNIGHSPKGWRQTSVDPELLRRARTGRGQGELFSEVNIFQAVTRLDLRRLFA
ncbi:hypothetical protein [Achromobacter sp. ACM05]|uniref:hypothetical protein n=1 Tax=Achromobacter sp. ACM05 TaxID=2854776 RepID=UPI001C4613A7|nr:hypothetical protein [Achromobacter sp. ACM05]MBV7499759.1 hypothetical protein [Achromobacter sp. ACM05]